MNDYDTAAQWIEGSRHAVAFTGAGISVESGIPTFRGPEGLWSRYDPKVLDLGYFYEHPRECWKVIKEIFYDYMGAKARPNAAHRFLAELEKAGKLEGVITQNIDNLHQEAGSWKVVEFHGTAQTLVCTECGERTPFTEHDLEDLPPLCKKCGGLLKPDFIFFGEAIPPAAYQESLKLLEKADLLIVVGTTGEVMPASMIPYEAKGAKVIEINVEPSAYTHTLTGLFLQAPATQAARELASRLKIDLE
ncbi:NAD-dependent deacylase [Nitratifractor sp.]|uniref:SIR2 family NAD-dependent protein deacylase n=1 Tax=Nitratifractor sp. TaxID=2268144 RepID=UPI0025F215EF|nr:NAD-dependent deacylase [Nitratifractor sp.]